MNPETNKFEALSEEQSVRQQDTYMQKQLEQLKQVIASDSLLRPDGTPVPEHWTVLKVDEVIRIKTHNFKVVYINEGTLVLEPAGPVLIGEEG